MNKNRVIAIATIVIAAISVGYYYVQQYSTFCSTSSIKTIDSYAQVVTMLQDIDIDTLVLFDVDETLIIPADVMLRCKTKEQHQEWLKKTIEENLPFPYDSYFEYCDLSPHPYVLIEPLITTIIDSLQQRGIKVLALTLADTGSRGRFISFFPENRFASLQRLGIDFSKVNIPDTTFNQLPEKNGTYPMLYKGILCTNYQSKGIVLGVFLDYMHWKPSKVIFFDDSLKRVKQVVDEMCKRGIPCIGYEYKGSEYVPGELDKDVATLQIKYLLEHEQWLSDAQARELLKKEATDTVHALNSTELSA